RRRYTCTTQVQPCFELLAHAFGVVVTFALALTAPASRPAQALLGRFPEGATLEHLAVCPPWLHRGWGGSHLPGHPQPAAVGGGPGRRRAVEEGGGREANSSGSTTGRGTYNGVYRSILNEIGRPLTSAMRTSRQSSSLGFSTTAPPCRNGLSCSPLASTSR